MTCTWIRHLSIKYVHQTKVLDQKMKHQDSITALCKHGTTYTKVTADTVKQDGITKESGEFSNWILLMISRCLYCHIESIHIHILAGLALQFKQFYIKSINILSLTAFLKFLIWFGERNLNLLPCFALYFGFIFKMKFYERNIVR